MTMRHGIHLLLVILAAVAARPAWGDELAARREARRAAVRAAATALGKSAGSAPFGLLVIPVDFADARLAAGWHAAAELAPRLEGKGETLRNYFAVASAGRTDLQVVLAPLVRLPGARRDYSDVGYNGFTRTRRLAREAITAVRDLGFDLRRLDNDGPDGVAGTADDDGEVDGVLILHAGVGRENDLADGLVEPLQFFLDEPVGADGVAASFYAVAAIRSGLGIWAHETAHLLGLEDRYDPTLPAAGGTEVHARGGLGAFSLMAAGAWGRGDGSGAALPDAYSRWLLGWLDATHLPTPQTTAAQLAPGEACRVWTHGAPGDEFYFLEVRDPAAAAPFDAAVPAGGVVIYHVDETVPEGVVSTRGRDHLRVRVVEADGDDGLEAGNDDGSAADLFPGTTGADAFAPETFPTSDGYAGPSHVRVTEIRPVPAAASPAYAFNVRADDGPAVAVDLGFAGTDPATLRLDLRSLGAPVGGLVATVTAAPPALGAFAGGGTERTLALVEVAPGLWRPGEEVLWNPAADLPADAATRFVVAYAASGWSGGTTSRTWQWRDNVAVLDFAAAWPGGWAIDHPTGQTGTTWTRWDDRSPAVAVGGYVLACVDLDHATGEAWPDVAYDNNALTRLTSAPLGPGVTAVRLVHAWDTEALVGKVAMDGGVVLWVGPDGGEVPAVPVDGWPATISPQAVNTLHGRSAWGGAGELDPSGRPLWRTDVLPLPTTAPGPWRLRLVFASNTRGWQHRGWQIAACEALTDPVPESALPLSWDGTELRWTWPDDAPEGTAFAVQRRGDDGWTDVPVRVDAAGPPAHATFVVTAAEILAALPGRARTRHELRVTGPTAEGTLASAPLVVFPDGGDGEPVVFGRPWPNPAAENVRFLLTVPAGAHARLGVHDLRGRLLRTLDFPPGDHIGVWDGRTGDGRAAAAGTYILRLEGSGRVLTHKVVLLH